MARLRYNGLAAELGGSGLTNSATSITFAAALTHSGGTNVPTITGSDYIPLSLFDSDGVLKEVVYLTAYTAAGTSGTISRGKEGTSGVSHTAGTQITHSPLVSDVGSPSFLLDHGTTPSSSVPEGSIIYWKAPATTTWSFTGGSLPSGWTARSTPTSVSFDGTGMTATYDAGDGYQVAMPVATPSECVLEAKFVSGGSTSIMLGAILADSGGGGVGSVYYSSPSGVLAARASGWTYGSSFESVTVATTYPAWMRVRMTLSGATYNYKASRSLDGATFSSETANVTGPTSTSAPTVCSIGSLLGTVTAKVEWVKFSGGTGGLRGWWDGSSVVSF